MGRGDEGVLGEGGGGVVEKEEGRGERLGRREPDQKPGLPPQEQEHCFDLSVLELNV